MARIAIIIHQRGSLAAPYFMRTMADFWAEAGHEILVVRPPAAPEADLAIVHVDLTVVPSGYPLLAARYPKALNVRITDISKRKISLHLVERGDGYDGPVLVKTNENCGGLIELLTAGRPPDPALVAQRLDYKVYPSPSAVPARTWQDPVWVVERFLPERSGEFFCLRTWMFFGDRETNSLSFSREAIVKSQTVIRREVVADVPPELRELRRDMGVDFGKIDYAVVDGRPIVYDVNKTPFAGNLDEEQVRPRIALLAEGLASYLDGAP